MLQFEICRLSLLGSNEMAIHLVKQYSMSILIKYIVLNSMATQHSFIQGSKFFFIKNHSYNIALLNQSKKFKLVSLSAAMKVKFVKIFDSSGTGTLFKINTILNRVLQTQLCLLLDPFYEAKYPEHMYGFRKGRNAHQAVGFLKCILEK